MSEWRDLPTGWATAILGELGNWSSGGTPSRSNPEYYGGDICWVKSGDLVDAVIETTPEKITNEAVRDSAAKIFPTGTLLIAMYGATIGKLGVLGIPAATNQACAALLPNGSTENVIPWVGKYLRLERDNLRDAGKGGAQPNISQAVLKEYSIPVAPLNEQRRIVAKIDALQARSRRAREALDSIPALLERFRQSVLAAAFRGDLTADWRAKHPDVEPASVLLERIRAERKARWIAANPKKAGKYVEPEPVDPEKEGLPELPEGWCWASVEQIGVAIVDCPHSTPVYGAGDHFALDTNAMTPSGINQSALRQLSKEAFDDRNRRLIPLPGDVVFAREGTVGTAVVLPGSPPLCLGQRVMLIRPAPGVSPFILANSLMSPLVRAQYMSQLVGTTVAHINMRDIVKLAIPVPPEAEQPLVLSRLNKALSANVQQISIMREISTGLSILDQSILAKAFRGELVPQDPADEPASVLLDRIKAERAAQTGKPRGRGKSR
jgi:type I restriction enzyme S subunit